MAVLFVSLTTCDQNINIRKSYEIYPELEEIFTERKEAFIEDLAEHYGQEIPFLYEHCPDV